MKDKENKNKDQCCEEEKETCPCGCLEKKDEN